MSAGARRANGGSPSIPFTDIERLLTEWWDQPGKDAVVDHDECSGEWVVVIDGRRFSLSALALALTHTVAPMSSVFTRGR